MFTEKKREALSNNPYSFYNYYMIPFTRRTADTLGHDIESGYYKFSCYKFCNIIINLHTRLETFNLISS